MLHSFLFAPFADAAAEAQFEAVYALLHAEAEAAEATTLLLGNLELPDVGLADAVILRPTGITVLIFVPRGGSLQIPGSGFGPWQLGGQPLPGRMGAANPFAEFKRQQRALAAWLSTQPFLTTPVRPENIAGIVLFAQPVAFGSEVEARLHAQPDSDNFQLLSSLPHLPRRLRQLASPATTLPAAALQQWAQLLQAESEAAETEEVDAAAPEDFWTQKARQLWRWLGAEDIPPDTAYAAYAPDAAAEQQRLTQIQQQVRAELDQHTQALNARELEREQTIRELQAQLTRATSASQASADLQARLAAETREKDALHEAMRLAQAESAARNRELDARIAQLGTLIQQLHARPAPSGAAAAPSLAVPPPAPAGTASPGRPATRTKTRRPSAWQLQPWRAVALLAVLVLLGAAGWGLSKVRWGTPKPAAVRREAAPVTAAPPAPEPEEAAPAADSAASPLEERLNHVIIDSTDSELDPASDDSVQPASQDYQVLDSLEDQ